MKTILSLLLPLLMLAILPARAADQLNNEQAALLCSEAEAFFHEANELSQREPARARELCRKAAARYERVLSEANLHNSKIYYNLGNIYFSMQDIGRAILNYRRAQQLNPNDRNLLQNLQFARAQRQDHFTEPEQTRVLKTLFFWHYDFPIHLRQLLFMTAFLLFWATAIVFIWYRTVWLKAGLFFTIILSLGMGLSLLLSIHKLRNKHFGVILTPEVVAHKGDSESYAPSFTDPLHAGTEFKLLEQRQSWSEIQLPDGQTGWLPNKDFELL